MAIRVRIPAPAPLFDPGVADGLRPPCLGETSEWPLAASTLAPSGRSQDSLLVAVIDPHLPHQVQF